MSELLARGLVVCGTHAHCGKTVAAAGLAGVMTQLGFKAQAIKPLEFLPGISLSRGCDQAYFERLHPPLEPVEPVSPESARACTGMDWQRMIENCRKRVYPYLLEAPGNVASPIRFEQDGMLDAIDLAKALEARMLVVTGKAPDIIGRLAPIFAYLWHRDAEVAGWLAVETSPVTVPDWDSDIWYLRQHYSIPYLGEIAYSPSISVETMQQGNLLYVTETGIDFLPIHHSLELVLP